MKIKLLVISSLILIFSSCSKSIAPKAYLSEKELVSLKGEPLSKSNNLIKPSSQMYQYENESYQVEDGQVLAKFRDPIGDEKNIQYWRHTLEGSDYKIEELVGKSHNKEFQLLTKNSDLIVQFNESGNVLRISSNVYSQTHSNNESEVQGE